MKRRGFSLNAKVLEERKVVSSLHNSNMARFARRSSLRVFAAFAAIWSMFMIIGYVSSGTYILRKHKTASAIGFLLGMSFMISQLFFVLFVMFASFATTASEIDLEITDEHATSSVTSDRWVAAFSFFIFLVTAIFGVVLGKFRHDGIIPVSEMDATTAAGLGAKMPVQQGGSNSAV